jgi:hypothetical protein
MPASPAEDAAIMPSMRGVGTSRPRPRGSGGHQGSAASEPSPTKTVRIGSAASGLSFGTFKQTPKLKSRRGDRLFNGLAREVVRRLAARCNRARHDPGTVLSRQVVDIGIARKCAQTLSRHRLEDIYAHGVPLCVRFQPQSPSHRESERLGPRVGATSESGSARHCSVVTEIHRRRKRMHRDPPVVILEKIAKALKTVTSRLLE